MSIFDKVEELLRLVPERKPIIISTKHKRDLMQRMLKNGYDCSDNLGNLIQANFADLKKYRTIDINEITDDELDGFIRYLLLRHLVKIAEEK